MVPVFYLTNGGRDLHCVESAPTNPNNGSTWPLRSEMQWHHGLRRPYRADYNADDREIGIRIPFGRTEGSRIKSINLKEMV
uniref:Uncharacterized protein n=1 Tax=Timema cristinae TaxID=61476 RepID=A0A7R9CXK6_TIMCR|nr:unnamed protein product [Timema cristinae]